MTAISFEAVSKTFQTPRGPLQALDGVSLKVQEGEFFGLLGPNGAGKTTLISILAGLTRATSGVTQVQGCDVQTQAAQARRLLGVVPQELVFDPFFNVREALRFQSGYFGIRKNDAWIDELLDCLGLSDKANSNMRQLSGGMKRRVLVAQALVHKPPVIVLDEPTAGVDVVHVPYRGASQAALAVATGEVQLMSMALSLAQPFLQDNRVRLIGYCGTDRHAQFRDIPTLQEQGVRDYDYSSWVALFLHKDVPADVLAVLRREAQAISEDKDFQQQLIRSGLEPWPRTAAQLGPLVEGDFQRWKKIIQDANIQGT